VPVLGTAEYQLRLSAFRFRFFFRSLLSFCSSLPGKRREAPSSTKSPGNPCGSEACQALSTGARERHVSMEYRVKPGGDE
jgi:hypothetical protein